MTASKNELREHSTIIMHYFLGGVLFGCLFPIIGTLIRIWGDQTISLTLSTIVDLHLKDHLLQIIDLAPPILGGAGYWIGTRVAKERGGRFVISQTLEEMTILKEALERNSTELEAIFETAGDGIRILNPDGIVERSNNRFSEIFSIPRNEVIGFPCKSSFHGPVCGTEKCPHEMIKEGHKEVECEVEIINRRGELFHIILRARPLTNRLGEVWGVVEEFQDVTELKTYQQKLFELSTTDELTRLLNRRGFNMMAGKQLKLSERLKSNCCLVFADMDNMKPINDTYGHESGDRALQMVANILSECFRETDTIARLGGDEFVVLASGDADTIHGESIINRISQSVDHHNEKSDEPFIVGLSVGVVVYDATKHSDVEALVQEADDLMYQIKRQKKQN